MPLEWDAVGRGDVKIMIVVRVIYQDKVQDGRVTRYQYAKNMNALEDTPEYIIVFIPDFYPREGIILILPRRLFACQGETHRSANGNGTTYLVGHTSHGRHNILHTL